MKGRNVVNLSDEYLRGYAAGDAARHDPHAMIKRQGKRQVEAVLAVSRPPPAESELDLAGSEARVAELQEKSSQATYEHHRRFGYSRFGAEIQASLAAIAKIDEALHLARHRVQTMSPGTVGRPQNERLQR